MAYKKKSEIINDIRVIIITLYRILHDGEGRIYTNVDDWPYTVAINIKNEGSDMETFSIKELQLTEDRVMCLNNLDVFTEIDDLSRQELIEIKNMLTVTYEDLKSTDN